MTDTNGKPRAVIVTNEPWHPGSGYAPPITITDETFDWVIGDMGREGVSWLRVHVDGRETWINLANVVSINEGHKDD